MELSFAVMDVTADFLISLISLILSEPGFGGIDRMDRIIV
jgi:hypothetical protein